MKFNLDEGKIESAFESIEMFFWQGKKAEIVLILFLTFAVFICLWLCQNHWINHVFLGLKHVPFGHDIIAYRSVCSAHWFPFNFLFSFGFVLSYFKLHNFKVSFSMMVR